MKGAVLFRGEYSDVAGVAEEEVRRDEASPLVAPVSAVGVEAEQPWLAVLALVQSYDSHGMVGAVVLAVFPIHGMPLSQ